MNCYCLHSRNFEMKRTGSKDFSIASILGDKLESRSRSLARNVRRTDFDCGKDSNLSRYTSDSAAHFNEEANYRQCNCDLLPEAVYNRCATVLGLATSSEADIKSANHLGRKAEKGSLNCSERDPIMHNRLVKYLPSNMIVEGKIEYVGGNSAYSMVKESNYVSGRAVVDRAEKWEARGDVRNQERNKVSKSQVVRENCPNNRSQSGSNTEIIEKIGETLVGISSNASLDGSGKNCVLAREDDPIMSKPRSTVGFRTVESSKRVPGRSSMSSFDTATTASHQEKTSEGGCARPKSALSPSPSPSPSPRREKLDWLEYTRYRPPKIPRRVVIGREKRRKPSVHPRIPFSSPQLQFLEEKFRTNVYLTKTELTEIASILRLPHSRVKIWFQNRRARARREKKCLYAPR